MHIPEIFQEADLNIIPSLRANAKQSQAPEIASSLRGSQRRTQILIDNGYIKFFILIILFIVKTAVASEVSTTLDISEDHPVHVEADQVYYDKIQNLVYAQGKVVLVQDKQTIMAEELVYYRNDHLVYALKDVVMLKEDGSVYFSDEAKLNLNTKAGIAVNFKGRMGSKGLVAARGAAMIDNTHTELEDFVYSPCKVCKENLRSDYPLWEIRAANAELDKEAERIYYKHAFVEAFGVPVFYTPYFSTPAPSAKRKSGFLPPRVRLSSIFGPRITTPYYLNIAPNKDITYSPTFSQKLGTVHEVEFRHKIVAGEYKFKTSFTNTDKLNKQNIVLPGKAWRGHVELKGEFNVHKNGYLDANAKLLYDKPKDYLRKYDINNDQVLTNDFNYRYFDANNFYSARSLIFQGLRPIDDTKTTLNALPILDAYYENKLPAVYSSRLYMAMNAANLLSREGNSYQRFNLKPGIITPVKLPYGQLASIETSLRSDFYIIRHKPIIKKKLLNDTSFNENKLRLYPEVYSQWSWPFVNYIQNHPVIIEPVVGLAVAPRVRKLKNVNSDSQAPEISAVNVFTNNRYTGFDKIEDGNRINYGLRANVRSDYFKNLNIIAGQVLRQHNDSEFDIKGGLAGTKSNYATKVVLQLNNNVSVSHRARYDHKSFTPMRNELNLNISYPTYFISAIYAGVNRIILDHVNNQKFRHELYTQAGYNIYDAFWLKGHVYMGLQKKLKLSKSMIEDGISLEYRGDCLIFEIGLKRDITKLTTDAKAATTKYFRFIIPTF